MDKCSSCKAECIGSTPCGDCDCVDELGITEKVAIIVALLGLLVALIGGIL